MVSAFLLLLAQSLSWQNTFVVQNDIFIRGEGLFSNGFRYLNWLIDVPLLLLQLVVVLGLATAAVIIGALALVLLLAVLVLIFVASAAPYSMDY